MPSKTAAFPIKSAALNAQTAAVQAESAAFPSESAAPQAKSAALPSETAALDPFDPIDPKDPNSPALEKPLRAAPRPVIVRGRVPEVPLTRGKILAPQTESPCSVLVDPSWRENSRSVAEAARGGIVRRFAG